MSDITVKDIEEWQKLDKLLKKTKIDEMALRKKISKSMKHTNGKADKKFGELRVVSKQGITTKVEDKEELLEEWGGLSPELQACFPLDVKFSKTGYNKLDDDDTAIADVYIIESPAAPTLEVKAS